MLNPIKSFRKLEELVKKRGMSFYSLSKDLDMPTSFFSEWKRGKMMPKVDKLQKLADYFGVSIEYFLEDTTQEGG